MSGTVNQDGSSMPPSSPVKVISVTATEYGKPAPINMPAGTADQVPGTPLGMGAPLSAPSQTNPVGGTGATEKGLDAHPDGPTLAPRPPSAATTGPKIAAPSVNYNANQETPANVEHLGASGRDYADAQQQQLQDKGGA